MPRLVQLDKPKLIEKVLSGASPSCGRTATGPRSQPSTGTERMEHPDALESATRLRTGTVRGPHGCAIDNSEMRPFAFRSAAQTWGACKDPDFFVRRRGERRAAERSFRPELSFAALSAPLREPPGDLSRGCSEDSVRRIEAQGAAGWFLGDRFAARLTRNQSAKKPATK